jgi:hypothetical protein
MKRDLLAPVLLRDLVSFTNFGFTSIENYYRHSTKTRLCSLNGLSFASEFKYLSSIIGGSCLPLKQLPNNRITYYYFTSRRNSVGTTMPYFFASKFFHRNVTVTKTCSILNEIFIYIACEI